MSEASRYNPASRRNLRQYRARQGEQAPGPHDVPDLSASPADIGNSPTSTPPSEFLPISANTPQAQALSPLGRLTQKAIRALDWALTSRKVSPAARLSAAFYVLGSVGIGPQQSGARAAATDPRDPLNLAGAELAAFIDAGARAVALRRARDGAVDAEIVGERQVPVIADENPQSDQQ